MKKKDIKKVRKKLKIERINIINQTLELDVLKRLKKKAMEIKDKRVKKRCTYKLWDVVVLTVLAILGNAQDWEEIEMFGSSHKKYLRQFLKLTGGIPPAKTIENIIATVRPSELTRITIDFVNEICCNQYNSEKEILSFDGRVNKGSRKNKTYKSDEIKPLNVLNVYSSKYRMCIDQEMIDEKTNEIPTIPIVIDRLNIKDVICTWDALNTQKANIEAVIKNGGDYVVPIKGNHKNFKKEISDYFDEDTCNIIKSGYEGSYLCEREKSHNKIITYEYYQTEKIEWFEENREWKGLKSFTYVLKKMEDLVTGEITKERRYYISSLLLNIRQVSLAIRNHWQVENKLHWHLDFTFKLDNNKTLNKKALLNFEIMTKLCLKILNIVKKEYDLSLKKIRYKISLNVEEEINNIFKILASQKENFTI